MKNSILLSVGLYLMAGVVPSSQASPGFTGHKVEVHDAASAQALAGQGGRLIADYGAYQLYDVPQLTAKLPDSAELRDTYNSILLNSVHLDTTKAEVQSLRKSVGTFSGKRMHLIHFSGPVQTAWRKALLDAGVEIVSYVPYNAYLVYGDATSIARVQAMGSAPHVQWDGPYLDDYKIHPLARTLDKLGNPRKLGTDRFGIQLVADPVENATTLAMINRLKLAPLSRQRNVGNFVDVVVRLSAADLANIAARPDVVSIQPQSLPKKVCERQDEIVSGNLSGSVPAGPGYLAWLESKGFTQAQFTTSRFIVDVSDSGIDNGTTNVNHFGLYANGEISQPSRVFYNVLQGTPNLGSTKAGCDGHGNLNAHIVMGFDNGSGFPFADAEGYHYGLGVCPFVNVGSSVIFDPDNSTDPDPTTVISDAYGSGARISNNSWGDGDSADDGTYGIDSYEYDSLVRDAQPDVPGNQQMVIVFAAGNDGPDRATVSPPGTGKNVITVGGAQNVQPFGGCDSSEVCDNNAENANSIVFFSGRGPCLDGRRKPDIVAPCTHVSGGAPQADNPAADGTALACFLADGDGVSGGVGTNKGVNLFFPDRQEFYTASSGTSHSTPCISGACALVRQYFINNSITPPSPAMTKAFLMNSTRFMTGAAANDTLWSENQGMGELNLGTAFDGVSRILRDEVSSDTFTASGQSRTFSGAVDDPTKPFRVTVSWTDAPGSTTGNAYNNELDLTVFIGGLTYKGNVFSRSNSVTGGAVDAINDVQSVFLPAGVTGSFIVTVTAANINSVGVPNATNGLNQDFALVVYNATPQASVVSAGYTITNAPCGASAITPGETVTVNLAIENVGNSPTTNLVATLLPYLLYRGETAPGVALSSNALSTLLADNQIAFPSGPQTIGVLGAGATANVPFTFVADGSCGESISAMLQLQDGSASLGTVNYAIQMGIASNTTTFTQNFDGNGGALPSGWSSSVAGTGLTGWSITSATNDTAPYSATCPDNSTVGEVYLLSPTISITGPSNQLTFRNDYNLEDTYDGGVLEIAVGTAAINSGTFVDILAAGGSFVSGSYTGTVTDPKDSGTQRSPLYGREAWTGNSGGFLTTTVDLPAAAAGTNIQLRWACGTDGNNTTLTGTGGWWIDTVSIGQPFYDCSNCPATNGAAMIVVFPTNNYELTTITPEIAVTGWASNFSTVVISNSGVFDTAAMADQNGIFTALTPLNFGSNQLSVAAGSNAAGNIIVYLTLGPPVLDVPAVVNTSVTITGQAAPGATVSIYQGDTVSASPLATFVVNASGEFSGTITLPLGPATLIATEATAGQVSASTAPVSISVVAEPPPVILTPANGTITNKLAVTVTGTGEKGAKVTVYDFANNTTATVGTATIGASKHFSISAKLEDGANILYAAQSAGGVTSPYSSQVEVADYLAPQILVQPVSQTNFLKGTATFTAEVVGAAPMKIYWQKNGVTIKGVTTSKLTLADLKTNSVGNYNLVASNAYGVAASAAVTLTLVENPFGNLTGVYSGLFEESPARFESSGFLSLTLNDLGFFTAKILNAGGTYSYSGGLSGVGWASNVISRGGANPPLTVVLNMNVTNGSNQILGAVFGGANWTAGLKANLAPFSKSNPFPDAGKYTVVFAGTNSDAHSPGGDGYGTVNISSTGMTSLTGLLPDNTAIAPAAVGLSRYYTWPLYIPLYGKAGSLIGWINFTNEGPSLADLTNTAPVSFAGTNVSWFRTNADGKIYSTGFTNNLAIVGSVFVPADNAELLSLSDLDVLLSGGDLSAAISNGITATAGGKFTATGSGITGLKLNLNPANGVVSGSFDDNRTTPIKGVIFQDQTNAAGFFLNTDGSGLFLLTPP